MANKSRLNSNAREPQTKSSSNKPGGGSAGNRFRGRGKKGRK